MTTKTFSPWFSLAILTIFQIMMGIQFIAARGSKLDFTVLLSFGLLTVTMWAFCIFLRSLKRTSFEMECIAFFLCTINLAVVATTSEGAVFKQLIAIILGVVIFFILCWYLRDLDRALSIRRALIIISCVLLLVNLVFGSSTNGSTNWINVGGMITTVKKYFGYDDALDAFGCHGIGGIWGGIATGLFTQQSINPAAGWDGLVFSGNFHLMSAQLIAIGMTIVIAAAGTFIIAKVISLFVPLRVGIEEEKRGLDMAQHGESAYPSFNGLD